MDEEKREELADLLTILPQVEFCCVYGSTLHPNNHDKSRMIDYILGVRDPIEWHEQNLQMNRSHYASWMVYLGGAKLITGVADEIGVGVHFNPFVSWNNKTFKYGVVRMHDLLEDILNWERFYLSGRLQKPVNVLVDSMDVENLNSLNLRAATSTALLLLPSKFTERTGIRYAKFIASGMLITPDIVYVGAYSSSLQVKNIVQGQFDLFRRIYKPVLEEFASKDLLRFSSLGANQDKITQDCDLPAVQTLVSRLPKVVRSKMSMKLAGQRSMNSGQIEEFVIKSRTEAAKCVEKILRRKVMVSSVRQAVSGVLTVGATRATRYLANKMHKAWKSWR